jgi:RNA polymerase sigma-70 factor (ECF subfamily)
MLLTALARTGDIEAADGAYARAIGLEPDPAVRRLLQRCRAALRVPRVNPTGSA